MLVSDNAIMGKLKLYASERPDGAPLRARLMIGAGEKDLVTERSLSILNLGSLQTSSDAAARETGDVSRFTTVTILSGSI